jgi:hypothetical protein
MPSAMSRITALPNLVCILRLFGPDIWSTPPALIPTSWQQLA